MMKDIQPGESSIMSFEIRWVKPTLSLEDYWSSEGFIWTLEQDGPRCYSTGFGS